MINFSEIKNILWDFDGVLMNSMPVRDQGFETVLKGFPRNQVDRLMRYHHENGGLSRYVKFRYFFEVIRGEAVTAEKINVLAGEFSTIMREALVQPQLLIEDSISFVKKHSTHFQMHIVSGSDGEELNFICRQLQLVQYFKSIQGSPTDKKQLIANVMYRNNYQHHDTLMIGDSGNDFDAAKANSIKFAGYNNKDLRNVGDGYIESFKNITAN